MHTVPVTTTELPQLIRTDLTSLRHPDATTLRHHLEQLANRAELAAESDDPPAARAILNEWLLLRHNSFRTGAGSWLNLPVFRHHRTRYRLHAQRLAE